MVNKLQSHIVAFAERLDEKTELFNYARDYYNHYKSINIQGCENLEFARTDKNGVVLTFDEKEARMNKKLREAVCRLSNVTEDQLGSDPAMYASHPLVNWATMALVQSVTDMVIPETIIESTGIYTEVRTIGYGDSMVFETKPRDLFPVAKAGMKRGQANLQKQYNGQVVVNPYNHMISVNVDMYRVLANLESLAEFMVKVARSIETEISKDVYDTFNKAMESLPTTGDEKLKVTGYTQASMVTLAQTVTAWNQGRKAVLIGTQNALAKVLPDNPNYRMLIDSDYVKVGYVKDLAGYDTLVLPQVADWTTPFKLALNDNYIYVVSPSSDKIVKLVLGGSTLTNVSSIFANANLVQTGTMYKMWGTGISTSSIAGLIELA